MKYFFPVILLFFVSKIYGQNGAVASVPFVIEKNCIYFYCKVNDTDSVRFLFDTGADGSVINGLSASKLNLQLNGSSLNVGANGTNEVANSTDNTVTLGTLVQEKVLFTVISFETTAFDGVFGTNLMKDYIVEINYQNALLNFYPKNDNSIDYTGYSLMKMRKSDVYPTAVKGQLVINGKKYKGDFGIDTGADDVLTIASPFAREKDFENKMTKIGSAQFQGSDGSVHELPIVFCPEVEFAGKSLYRLPIALSKATEGIDATDQLAGFYGNAFLKKFNVILDYDKQLIYFRLNHHLYSEFYEE